MKEIELIEKRKPREKHFLQEDGTIIAKVYNEDIHYLKDGEYKEIDNTLVNKDGIISNKSNDYKVEFKENFKESLMKMTKGNHYIDFKIRESKLDNLSTEKRKLSKKTKNITYNNITDDIKIEYQTLSDKVKETIVLQNANYSELSFELDTNLSLIEENGEIISKDINGNIIFRIEKPFMIDSNDIRNDDIQYSLKSFDDGYILTLILDDEWLNSEERVFPVYVDPTITNANRNVNIYDTYIYSGDTNINRANQITLKVGAENVNGNTRVNRALLKFPLPEIGTGSQIISATIDLICLSDDTNQNRTQLLTVHRITEDWTESSANWNSMNDKYDSKVESIFEYTPSIVADNEVSASHCGGGITSLVRKWYNDKQNYGILIKAADEVYHGQQVSEMYTKDNNISTYLNPIFEVTYRNQNGIENYLNYKQENFQEGNMFINTYNGNVTGIFDIAHTIGGQLPANIQLVYNTNDVVLNNNTFFGKGYRLNIEQTIKETVIDSIQYLEYIDENGTIHYFHKSSSNQNNSNIIYKDEENLQLTITKTDNICTMKSKYLDEFIFTKIGNKYYLTTVRDADNNEINIELDSLNRIIEVTDNNNSIININYQQNKIIFTSSDRTVDLNYNNGFLNTIVTEKGTTTFNYNNNSLIDAIVDTTGLKTVYEYYPNSPFRIKKVIHYGLNNIMGQFYSFEYELDSTTIKYNNEKFETLIFNSCGNLLSTNNIGLEEDISTAYSTTNEYGYEYFHKNRILSSSIPVRYIKNYLKNSSFEDNEVNFISLAGINMNLSTESPYQGNKCLKLDSTQANSYIQQYIPLLETEKYYTFSGYFKSTCDIKIELSFIDEEENEIISNQIISSSDEYDREDVSIYYTKNAESNLLIKIYALDIGTIYIDNIQLEEGEVANEYNIIENSDFSNGLDDWEISVINEDESLGNPNDVFEVVDIDNNKKALHISMNPMYTSRIEKRYSIKGKEGDLYTLAFWYKNNGVESCRPYAGNKVSIFFESAYENTRYGIPFKELNINESRWQYFSYRDRALEDFDSIRLVFDQNTEANDLYITNISFTKEETSGDYDYDDDGNLISIKNQSGVQNLFSYNSKNQLVDAIDTKGNKIKYEYDNDVQNRILSTTSQMGITNSISYDELGNPISSRISKCIIEDIDSNSIYRIRAKGTEKYIKANYRDILVEKNTCSNTLWKFIEENEKYKIVYSTLPNYSLSYSENVLKLSPLDENNLFRLYLNNNGTYYISVNDSSNTEKYLKVNDNQLELTTLVIDDPSFEFYIELPDNIYLESNVIYSEDGKYVISTTDNDLMKTTYTHDNNTGLVTSVTNSNGIATEYEYNDKNQIASITTDDKQVSYQYNQYNLLSNITQGDRQYNLEYDNFLNVKKLKIGNNITLIETNYDNNGNLLSMKYGNNDIINYTYDDFNRVNSIEKVNNQYNFKYDNKGNIAKILSSDSILKYVYDISNRINRYINNELEIKYSYDSSNNIINKNYRLNNNNILVNSLYNSNNMMINLSFENQNIDFEYDSLNRLIRSKINNIYNIEYEYVSFGKRATTLVKSILFGSNKYSYKYDNLKNITHIYLNNQLMNEYEYNQYNELICEINYYDDKKTTYTYDLLGNILNKKIYNNNDNTLVKTDIYQYSSNWKDQLINYNGVSIGYDGSGNPINIGNDINLSWKNGNELDAYIDTNNNISVSYSYNHNGIRTKKIINGVETKYYLEGSKIIYETKNGNTIYYIRDTSDDNLIGFKDNNDIYYYEKNLQGDVIGILDSSMNKIVEYKYNSWGEIIYTSDISENDISNINPIRYRSYYYDNETQLYYLNTRYYNAKWGRFLSSDTELGTSGDYTGYNLYAYASNNPINYSDPSGQSIISFIKKAAKKAKKIIKSAYKIAKSAIKVIVNTAKNIVSKVQNLTSTLKKSFVAEAEMGFGLSDDKQIFNTGGGYNLSKSFGWGYAAGKNYDYTSNKAGIEAFHKKYIAGLDADLRNYDEISNPMTMPWEIWGKENTVLEKTIGFTKSKYNIEADPTNNDGGIFIGISYSKYVGIGGAIKIGFNIK